MSDEVTGTLVWYYAICPRQVWLMAHEVEPEREYDLLAEGRQIEAEHYQRSAKDVQLPGMRIDRIRREKGQMVISEVKKSSHYMRAARLQVCYYLWRLQQEGVQAKGEVLVPEERKREVVELTPEAQAELEEVMRGIQEVMQAERPPDARKIRYCGSCAYEEFCWA